MSSSFCLASDSSWQSSTPTIKGITKVVDPATYKPSVGEKATIINKPQ
jgi:hypothetical protein